MAGSSINSGIQFESYKIDNISFSLVPEVSILLKKVHSNCEVQYQFSFRNALRVKEASKVSYITGLKIDLLIHDKDLNRQIATGSFVITGFFSSTGEFSKETEEKLIKVQAPTILFPYIRASISLILSTAGFSTVILPLINVAKAASSLNLKIDDVPIEKK